ncbi:hypothetical protein LTR62_002499 [Meristemomyces frigidus]|uniref:RRM domain-containing protein n=1 Tax=Meristemomyces frigidus TaxID=1508187 RepID=A0AAN7T8K5_9PEZI|nr:hypothetical protein LTR62_002499 [Meristemomyces frigidus]
MSDQSRQKATVFVGGLDNQVTQQTLHDAFIPFGEIVNVTLPKPELASASAITPHRGFGYIEFSLPADALEAIDNMDQSELYGRVLKCNAAKAQRDPSERLGARTAVWESEGYATKYNVAEDGDEGAGQQEERRDDPMQGLEGLAEAGPRQQ